MKKCGEDNQKWVNWSIFEDEKRLLANKNDYFANEDVTLGQRDVSYKRDVS